MKWNYITVDAKLIVQQCKLTHTIVEITHGLIEPQSISYIDSFKAPMPPKQYY